MTQSRHPIEGRTFDTEHGEVTVLFSGYLKNSKGYQFYAARTPVQDDSAKIRKYRSGKEYQLDFSFTIPKYPRQLAEYSSIFELSDTEINGVFSGDEDTEFFLTLLREIYAATPLGEDFDEYLTFWDFSQFSLSATPGMIAEIHKARKVCEKISRLAKEHTASMPENVSDSPCWELIKYIDSEPLLFNLPGLQESTEENYIRKLVGFSGSNVEEKISRDIRVAVLEEDNDSEEVRAVRSDHFFPVFQRLSARELNYLPSPSFALPKIITSIIFTRNKLNAVKCLVDMSQKTSDKKLKNLYIRTAVSPDSEQHAFSREQKSLQVCATADAITAELISIMPDISITILGVFSDDALGCISQLPNDDPKTYARIVDMLTSATKEIASTGEEVKIAELASSLNAAGLYSDTARARGAKNFYGIFCCSFGAQLWKFFDRNAIISCIDDLDDSVSNRIADMLTGEKAIRTWAGLPYCEMLPGGTQQRVYEEENLWILRALDALSGQDNSTGLPIETMDNMTGHIISTASPVILKLLGEEKWELVGVCLYACCVFDKTHARKMTHRDATKLMDAIDKEFRRAESTPIWAVANIVAPMC